MGTTSPSKSRPGQVEVHVLGLGDWVAVEDAHRRGVGGRGSGRSRRVTVAEGVDVGSRYRRVSVCGGVGSPWVWTSGSGCRC
jgi:hypothetical protein